MTLSKLLNLLCLSFPICNAGTVIVPTSLVGLFYKSCSHVWNRLDTEPAT